MGFHVGIENIFLVDLDFSHFRPDYSEYCSIGKHLSIVANLLWTFSFISTTGSSYQTDALLFQYTVSPVAMNNALNAQMDVMTGRYDPTGKMSLTMVSCPEVIAVSEKEVDGVMREICVSPNDVPGYDKDRYMDPALLKKVRGGSYAYCDEDGNYYRSGFGLRY